MSRKCYLNKQGKCPRLKFQIDLSFQCLNLTSPDTSRLAYQLKHFGAMHIFQWWFVLGADKSQVMWLDPFPGWQIDLATGLHAHSCTFWTKSFWGVSPIGRKRAKDFRLQMSVQCLLATLYRSASSCDVSTRNPLFRPSSWAASCCMKCLHPNGLTVLGTSWHPEESLSWKRKACIPICYIHLHPPQTCSQFPTRLDGLCHDTQHWPARHTCHANSISKRHFLKK